MSSKRAIRRRECGNKRRYVSMELAQAEARRMRRKGFMVRPYGCAWCGHIHLGHFRKDELPKIASQSTQRTQS